MSSMRIIHVAPTPFGSGGLFGGGERYPLELARALAPDVECELITFGRVPGRAVEPNGLRRRTLRAWAYLHGHPAHPVSPEVFGALRRADLIHVHHLRAWPSRVSAAFGRLRGQKVAVSDHGMQGGDWLGLLPRLPHRFLTVSEYSALELGAPPERTRVVYGGADPARFAPDPSVTRRGILFLGRLTPHKGVDRLIAALPPGAHLKIAGASGHAPLPPERDYPDRLRRLAAERDVQFLGAVDDASLPDLYRQAAVLALPSVHRTCYGKDVRVSELLGLAALEAMASGTPVVASRLGGLVEIVRHGITGFLVEPGNVDELRARLAELLGDPSLARRMGRNAREWVCERFTWHACAQRCLAAYAELLGPSQPPSH